MSSGHSGEVLPLVGRVDAPTVAYGGDDAERDAFVRPTRIGRYVVLDLIGVGGMGVVCTAYDPKLDRKVALKLLKERGPEERRTTTGQARLVREAQSLAKLSHPNIVTVHDVDTFEGRLYMAMEYIEGQTVAEWVEEEKPSWQRIVEVFEHAGRGLAAAHEAGITHRDFKPTNVRIGIDGRVRVLDFGLAKSNSPTTRDGEDAPGVAETLREHNDVMRMIGTTSDLKLTQVGRAVGTPAYMAPEQQLGLEVGPATDQFSFAVTLYEALFKRLPFGHAADGVWRTPRSQVAEPPKDSDVPYWLFKVAKRGLSTRQQDRYPTMDAMVAALRADPLKRRRRIVVTAIGATSLALAGFGVAQVLSPARVEVCAEAGERLAGVWDEARRAKVGEALRGTEATFSADTAELVVRAIDTYADVWGKQRVAVCEATRVHGEQSEALLDVRMACLDRRGSELKALVDVLVDADRKVAEQAVTMVAGLQPPSECATAQDEPAEALPEDSDLRRQVLVVRDQMDQVEALLAAGRHESATTIAAEVAARARALAHGPTIGRALLVQASTQAHDPKAYDSAERLLEETVLQAADRADARLEAEAWVALIWLKGRLQQKPEQALAWRIPAEAALRRASRPGVLEIHFMNNVAAVLEAQGRYDEALEFQRESLRLAMDLHGAEHPTVADLHGNLGVMLARTEQLEEAQNHLRMAVDLNERIKGRKHPDVALYAQNLGNVLMDQSERVEARAQYLRAREIRIEVYGPNHAKVAESSLALGILDRAEGKLESSERQLVAALDSFVSAYGLEDLRVAFARKELAAVSEARGHWVEAENRLREALAIYEPKYGAGHPLTSQSYVGLCRSLSHQGDLAEAERQCRLAIAGLGERPNRSGSELAEAQLQLGETLAKQGRLAEAKEAGERGVRSLRDARRPSDEIDRAQQRIQSWSH